MKLPVFALAAVLALAPGATFAHGQAPAAAHGGQVQDAQGTWVEFVVNGEHVEVYVMNEEGAPLPAVQITGTATVMVGGKPQKVNSPPDRATCLQARSLNLLWARPLPRFPSRSRARRRRPALQALLEDSMCLNSGRDQQLA